MTPKKSKKTPPTKDKYHSRHGVHRHINPIFKSPRGSSDVMSLESRKCESVDTLKTSTHKPCPKLAKVPFHEDVQQHSEITRTRTGLEDAESTFGISNKSFHNSTEKSR